MDIVRNCDNAKADQPTQSGTSQTPTVNPVETVLAAIAKLPIPPTAKYVGTIMVAMRLIDSKAIADFTGIPLRSVQRAMLQVSASGVIGAMSATSGAPVASLAPPVAPAPSPRVHAPAQKELPSGVNISQEVASKAREEIAEIEGLNGSTAQYVDWLAGWLKGDHGIKDHETARAILAGNVDAYGPLKVKAGMLELKAHIAQGNKPRDLGKVFSGYIKNAKLGKVDDKPKPTLRAALAAKRAAEAAGAAG